MKLGDVTIDGTVQHSAMAAAAAADPSAAAAAIHTPLHCVLSALDVRFGVCALNNHCTSGKPLIDKLRELQARMLEAHRANDATVPVACWRTADASALINTANVSRLVQMMQELPPVTTACPAEASAVWYVAFKHAVDFVLKGAEARITSTADPDRETLKRMVKRLKLVDAELHLDALLSSQTASAVAWHIAGYTPHI